jgi:hypothetical protein
VTTHQDPNQEISFAAFVGIDWVAQLRGRFGGRPVAICLEQTRGPLVYALMKYEFLVLYPIAPRRLARYADGWESSPTNLGRSLARSAVEVVNCGNLFSGRLRIFVRLASQCKAR